MYTAPSPTGPWTQKSVLNKCYYDCGLLIDDNDIMYIVWGREDVSISQLSSDGLTEVRSQVVLTSPPGTNSIEGNRLYKKDGTYYILNDYPGGQSTWVWKSSSIFGNWSGKEIAKNIGSPVAGGGSPHQGSLIKTPDGKWYFMSFTWSYPAGRMPVLAPVTWGSDGFPSITAVSGRWGTSYPYPLPARTTPSWTGRDTFSGTSLRVSWEWNHNPDRTKFSVNNGLTLNTATVTNDLYKARNTLTHRTHGPNPVATIELDFSNMADGDRTGLALLKESSAYIAVVRNGNSYTVTAVHGLMMEEENYSYITTSTGTTKATANVSKGKIWFRGSMDARPNGNKSASFSYSTDGSNFTALGGGFTLSSDWHFFMGYRWGIFNHATKALGGSVKVLSFTQT